MSLRVVQFLAVLLTALAFVPAGAHLFELPNKVDLSRDAYPTVQGIYAGWAWFGIIDLAALVTNVVLASGCVGSGERSPLPWLRPFASSCSSRSSSRGRSRPTRRPPTGRPCRTTGADCAGSGSTHMR